MTCTKLSVSCVLLVLPDLWVPVVSNEEPPSYIALLQRRNKTATATYRQLCTVWPHHEQPTVTPTWHCRDAFDSFYVTFFPWI